MPYAEKLLLGGGTHPQPGKYTYDPVTYAKQLLLGGITYPNPGKFMYHPVVYAEKLLLWALERADRRKASMALAESSRYIGSRSSDEPGSASSRHTADTSAVATARTGTQTASDDWQTQDAVSPRSGTSLAVLQAVARTRTPPLLRWDIQAAKSRGRGLMLATYAHNKRRPKDERLAEKAPDERAFPWPTRIGGDDTRRSGLSGDHPLAKYIMPVPVAVTQATPATGGAANVVIGAGDRMSASAFDL